MSHRRPSAALIVAVLALFVAMTGTGYAVSLPHHSVGTPQLKKDAVTSPKVKDGTLTSMDLDPALQSLLGQVLAPTGAWFAFAGGPVALGASPVVVVSAGLPAGQYSLLASVTAENQSANSQTVYCRVGVVSASAQRTANQVAQLQPFGSGNVYSQSLADTVVVTLPAAATVALSCLLDLPAGGNPIVDAYDAKLTAYGVDVK